MFNKKSQIKMMETISVLIVFLILMVFVVIFYVNISQANSGKVTEDLSNLKAVEIAQLISFMPEFQCSSRNIIDENCYDLLKLQGFLDYTTTNDAGRTALNTDYYDLLEFSNIVIVGLYPNEQVIPIYDRRPNDYTLEKKAFIPINLYDPLRKEYHFGMLNVTVYS